MPKDPYPLRNPTSCTRCPYNGNGSPCWGCKHSQLSNSGRCFVSLDAFDRPGTLLQHEPAIYLPTTTSAPATDLDPDTEDALRKILTTFADLTPDEILLLHGLLNGLNAPEIRDRYFPHLTRQAIFHRIKVASVRFPFFKALRKTAN